MPTAFRFWHSGGKPPLILNYSGPVSGSFTFTPGAVLTLATPGTYTFTWSRTGVVAGLFVGGGGGSGGTWSGYQGDWRGGKGGAGGFYETTSLTVSGSHSVVIGAGGIQDTNGQATQFPGVNCGGGGRGGTGARWNSNTEEVTWYASGGGNGSYSSGGGGGGGPQNPLGSGVASPRGEGGPTGWGNPGFPGEANFEGSANGGAGGGASTTPQGVGTPGQGKMSAIFGGGPYSQGGGGVTSGNYGFGAPTSTTSATGWGGLIQLKVNE